MQGQIITRQKCCMCGKSLVHVEKRRGCFCPDHPAIAATNFVVRFPGGIYQNHTSYEAAAQALNYLRHEKGSRQNKFDPEDYKSARPNSFAALATKYLERKKTLVSYGKICFHINTAIPVLGHMNVREINGAHIEDYLFGLEGISEKTRFNHMTQLRDFWKWCLRRGVINLAEMPIFPEIKYELGRRKITDWETQEKVLAKVKEVTYEMNPKIWLAIDMLATYTALRPGDLRRVYENSLDEHGILTIHNPTKLKNKFKTVRLCSDHINEWRSIQKKYPAMPNVLFFRHVSGFSGIKAGEGFGINILTKWWKKACLEVGLDGVPLYPGTKHTTATETAKRYGTEKALAASGLTNKAFNRYCDVERNDVFDVVTAIRKDKKIAKVVPLRKSE